jgi:hypothetical protein
MDPTTRYTAREVKDCGDIFCNEIDNCQCTLIQIQIQSQYCWLPLQIVVDHCVLYFYLQHVLFPWPFPGYAWLWVCWEDFSPESPSWIVAEWGLPISWDCICIGIKVHWQLSTTGIWSTMESACKLVAREAGLNRSYTNSWIFQLVPIVYCQIDTWVWNDHLGSIPTVRHW